MTERLILVRHGEAVPEWEDAAKPLSAKGVLQAKVTGEWLSTLSWRPQEGWHSGKLRAQQTAEIIAERFNNLPLTAQEGLSPNDEAAVFADRLWTAPECLLVVGHLPFLDKLVSLLLTDSDGRRLVRFSPACAVLLQRAEASWFLVAAFRPSLVQEAEAGG